jgi:hypothetical protein
MVRPAGAVGVGNWSGVVYNISTTGVGLALVHPVRLGTELFIEPLIPRSRPVSARVVRCVLETFVTLHGCQFVTPISEKELRRWVR